MTSSDMSDERRPRAELLFTRHQQPARAEVPSDDRPPADPPSADPPASASAATGAGRDDDAPAVGLERRMSRVERRLGEVAHALERLVPAVDAVRSLVVDELTSVHNDVRRTGAVVDSFSAALDAETSALGDQLQAGTHRIAAGAQEDRQALLDEVTGLLRDHLDRVVAPLADSPAPSGVVDDAVTRLRTTIESSLAAQASRVESVISTVRREMEASAAQQVEAVRARMDEIADQVDASANRVDTSVARVDDMAGRFGDRVAQARDELLADLARTRDLTGDRAERFAAETSQLVGSIQAGRADDTARLEDALDVIRRVGAEHRAPLDAVAATVESLHDDVRSSRDEALDDRRTVQGLVDRIHVLEGSVDELVAGLAEQFEGQRARAAAQWDAHLEAMVTESAATTDAVRRAATSATADLSDATEATKAELQSMVAAARRDLDDQVSGRLLQAQATLDETVSAVQALEQVFIDYLADRDRRIAVERATLTRAFVEQLGDNLSRRDRKRVARRLEVPPPPDEDVTHRLREVLSGVEDVSALHTDEAETAPSAGDEPQPADQPLDAPAREPVPDVEEDDGAEVVEDLGPISVVELLEDDDPPRWDNGVPTPGVRPRLKSRPVRSRASDATDPAATRRALQAVSGLGPAKQSALIDTFGTLDAIRAAPDEELLAIRGVGPSLLAEIRRSL